MDNIDNKPINKGYSLESNYKPHVCPVCGGNGLVPNGFYTQVTGRWSTTSTSPERCRTCGGTGVIWPNVGKINIA